MDLGGFVLRRGRRITLREVHIELTYGGLLEGYPNAKVNDHILARLPGRAQALLGTRPVHVVPPHRTVVPSHRATEPLGPMEKLPAITCLGTFESAPVSVGGDTAFDYSALLVVWLQDQAAPLIAAPVIEQLRDLPWASLAQDEEW